MKSISSPFLTLALITLSLGSLNAAGSLSEIKDLGISLFKQESVSVVNRSGGGNQNIKLKGARNNELIFEGSGGGELSVPMDDANLRLFFPLPREFQRAKDAFQQGNHEEVARLIGKISESLIPYTVIPPEKFNVHPMVLLYYQSLIQGENYKEAFRVAAQLPYKQLSDTPFVEETKGLLSQLIEQGQTDWAIKVLSTMYRSMHEDEFIPIARNVAGLLIRAAKYEDAQLIYRTLSNASSDEMKNLGLLWLAYCDYQKGDTIAAKVLLEAVPELDDDSENFPIYLLLLGRQALIDEDSKVAIEKLSLSMVLTPTDKFWKPELYYWNAIANRLEGYEPAVSALEREMKLYFPEDRWTDMLSSDIDNYPIKDES